MYKIIGADGKEYGPIPVETLRQWVAEGRVNAQTQILAEGATEWRPLSAYPEFVSTSAAAPPTLSAPAMANATARDEVNGPAIGLLVTAILGFLLQSGSLIMRLAGLTGLSLSAAQQNTPQWALAFYGTLGLISGIIALLTSVLVLVGALKMRNLSSYGLAMTASIVAMIPCVSPCCLVGLPIGIWALVVLSKPEVKSAFV